MDNICDGVVTPLCVADVVAVLEEHIEEGLLRLNGGGEWPPSGRANPMSANVVSEPSTGHSRGKTCTDTLYGCVVVANQVRSVIAAMSEHAAYANDSWSLPLDDHPAMDGVRRWVRQRLAGGVSADKLDDIVLVVVELVANAELHTRSPKRLTMGRWRDTVRVEVVDGDPSLPVLRPWSPTRASGRGIYIVDALSTDWGVRQCGQGKSVWSLFVSVTAS